MPAGRPRLEVVPGGGSSSEDSTQVPPGPHGVRWALALGVLLLIALVGIGVQTQRAARFEDEAESLRTRLAGAESELLEVRGQLDAHRRHLDQVSVAVDVLQELLGQAPVPPGETL